MTITANTRVIGFGQTTNKAPAAMMVSQAWAIIQMPFHDDRAARGAHSSSVKKSFGFTRAATAMQRLSHFRAGKGRTMHGIRLRQSGHAERQLGMERGPCVRKNREAVWHDGDARSASRPYRRVSVQASSVSRSANAFLDDAFLARGNC